MKKYLLLGLIFILLAPTYSLAADNFSANKLDGRILLQVESYGRAWYVNPVDGLRYYLKDGETAYNLMRTMSLGITNQDLAKIPFGVGQSADRNLVRRLAGRILLQVEARGEAWYVNPVDGLRYYLKDGEAAYGLMKSFALGISDADLLKISINDSQIVHDTTFDDVAYVVLRQGEIVAGKNSQQILPLASMSKLMSALVLLDQGLDWDRYVTITSEEINYPIYYAGEDATSEIDLKVGDVVNLYDLWVAMLVASSNQATIALVDNSGLSRELFVEAMNNKASAWGLKKTIFYDPTGLDAHNVTTPQEMAMIAKAAFSQPKIFSQGRQELYTLASQSAPFRTIIITDRNFSLKKYNVDVAKTGFLVEAQRCVALQKGEDIVVIMHARSGQERNNILDQLLVR